MLRLRCICLFTGLCLALGCPGLAHPTHRYSGTVPGGAGILTVRSRGGARIQIAARGLRTTLDLGKEVSGCLTYLYDPTDRKFRERSSADIKVIDRVRSGGDYYVVLMAGAESNCNIQGHCGAASDYTMIWIRLDSKLRLKNKQAVVVEDCRAGVGIIEPTSEDDKSPKLRLVGGKLTVLYGDYDAAKRVTTRLVYDRNTPEQGFRTSTLSAPPVRSPSRPVSTRGRG